MTIPDYQTLMLPVLEIAAKSESTVPEASIEIASRFGLSEEECEEMLPSGRQRVLHNRIHWAKFYLSKAGLVGAPKRGRFVATDLGRAFLKRKPSKIDNQDLMNFEGFREFYEQGKKSEPSSPAQSTTPPETKTPEEIIEAAFKTLNDSLRDELLSRLLESSPSFFETVIVDLLVAMGYGGSHKNAAQQLGKSGDGGVDGVINEDVLGLERVYIQAKRWALERTVGRPELQAFTGSLVGLGASKGVFVTTSSFTSQAADYVDRLPHRVILIDGKTLTSLMVEYGVGVRRSRAIEFKRIDEDYFSGETA